MLCFVFRTGKIKITDDEDRTTCDYIYAIGDVSEKGRDLTPVAVKAGVLLARRLAGTSQEKVSQC